MLKSIQIANEFYYKILQTEEINWDYWKLEFDKAKDEVRILYPNEHFYTKMETSQRLVSVDDIY